MPFPSAFPDVLSPDGALSASLATAVALAQVQHPQATSPGRFAISIVAIDDSSSPVTFLHAGLREREMHFSASLLKVAAAYAAFQLRQSVNSFAQNSAAATPADLFSDMELTLNPPILSAVPFLTTASTVPPLT